MDVEDDRGAGAEAGDLLDENREGDVVETSTAIFFRDQDAEQSEVGGLLHQVAGELGGVVDGFGARLDLPLGELPYQLADRLLLRAESELHLRLKRSHGTQAPLASAGGPVTWTMVASPCAIPEQIPAAP